MLPRCTSVPRELAFHEVELVEDLSKVIARLVSFAQRQLALRIVGEASGSARFLIATD
jgi:hypothetical protein